VRTPRVERAYRVDPVVDRLINEHGVAVAALDCSARENALPRMRGRIQAIRESLNEPLVGLEDMTSS
jgi:hypothetical protein